MTYYIWSFRNHQWWGPDRAGYTLNLTRAGRYDAIAAGEIAIQGLPNQQCAVDETLANHLVGLSAEQVEEKLAEWRTY